MTYQAGVTNELPRQPQEWFLEVVVGFGGDVVVLKVLFSMESDGLGLDFALFHINFIACQDDRDILADANEVTWCHDLVYR